MVQIALLTPPGSGAIAVLALEGETRWEVVRKLFRPFSNASLPEKPQPGFFRFGRFGAEPGDEVILSCPTDQRIEIHCHGGRKVIEWLQQQCLEAGATKATAKEASDLDALAWSLLPQARTLRTAAILLDQAKGAYQRAENVPEQAESLRRFASLGKHLVEPWRVVVAGVPNAGKSSLINALAGYQRSIVSPIPGTTRDAVSVLLAFDGWPVELVDTAGVRQAVDPLEQAGIERTVASLTQADLCLWVIDSTNPSAENPLEEVREWGVSPERVLILWNKIDLSASTPVPTGSLGVSAATGTGLEEVGRWIATTLVPEVPAPGAAVPFTPALAERWKRPASLVEEAAGGEASGRSS